MARRSTKSKAVKVNFKDVESRKTPPESDYIVEVTDAVMGKSGNNNDQIEFTLEIAKGEYKGTKLWLYCPLQENSLWKLHAFLTALGQEVPEEEMEIDLSELVGEKCVGVVTHETYQGKKRAKMTDFETIENYKGSDDDDKDDKKKSKKSKDKAGAKDDKKSKKEEPEAKDKKKAKDKGGKDKDAKSEKKDKKPKVKKYDGDDIDDMDEDELKAVLKEAGLKVDLKGLKLKKQVAAVRDALEEADLLND